MAAKGQGGKGVTKEKVASLKKTWENAVNALNRATKRDPNDFKTIGPLSQKVTKARNAYVTAKNAVSGSYDEKEDKKDSYDTASKNVKKGIKKAQDGAVSALASKSLEELESIVANPKSEPYLKEGAKKLITKWRTKNKKIDERDEDLNGDGKVDSIDADIKAGRRNSQGTWVGEGTDPLIKAGFDKEDRGKDLTKLTDEELQAMLERGYIDDSIKQGVTREQSKRFKAKKEQKDKDDAAAANFDNMDLPELEKILKDPRSSQYLKDKAQLAYNKTKKQHDEVEDSTVKGEDIGGYDEATQNRINEDITNEKRNSRGEWLGDPKDDWLTKENVAKDAETHDYSDHEEWSEDDLRELKKDPHISVTVRARITQELIRRTGQASKVEDYDADGKITQIDREIHAGLRNSAGQWIDPITGEAKPTSDPDSDIYQDELEEGLDKDLSAAKQEAAGLIKQIRNLIKDFKTAKNEQELLKLKADADTLYSTLESKAVPNLGIV